MSANPPGPGQPKTPVQLPQRALERLQTTREPSGKRLFTSDLSVNEFLLVKEAGFDPVGLVVGTSIYHIGFQYSGPGQSTELGVLTQAMYTARELAMSRMEAESLAEFKAIGTAVRARDGQSYRNSQGKPFTSDLSGQDFRTLLAAGYRPLALTIGTCVYHVGIQSMRQMLSQLSGKNVEMANYTQALYDARELAMERMQYEAEQVGADGIVGARILEGTYGWDAHVIEFFALGTAVVATRAEHEIEKPQMVISLNDGAN